MATIDVNSFNGNWAPGSLEMEWESDTILIGTNTTNKTTTETENTSDQVQTIVYDSLLQHSWINEDTSGLERPIRQEVSIAKGWVTLECASGPFYFHKATQTCCWSQPYNIPSTVPPQEHVPPLGVFSRKRTQQNNQKLTEETENDGFKKSYDIKHRRVKIPGYNELSPTGKTAISFLQEFTQRVLNCSPEYRLSLQEDPENPFRTTVVIRGEEYGSGVFSNKKQSRQVAAENALENLCPGVFPRNERFHDANMRELEVKELERNKETLMIDDERVLLLNMDKTPAQLLQEYCNREGIALGWESEILDEGNENRVRLFAVVSGERVCSGDGKNKKEAKQRVAQNFLKELHPNIHSWTDLLKLFAQFKSGDKTAHPSSQLLITLKDELRKAIENQAYVTFDSPDAFYDASESVRMQDY